MRGSAAYDTLRRSLGLTIPEAAAFHGVDERTVRYWVNKGPGKPEPLTELIRLEMSLRSSVGGALEAALSTSEAKGSPVEIVLYRYKTHEGWLASEYASTLPRGAHAVLIQRVFDALTDENFEVVIDWAD